MTVAKPTEMTAAEFIAWAMEQPEGERYELVAGEVIGMAPERAAHARVKSDLWLGLRTAVQEAGVDCEVFPDGMSVVIDEVTVYEPDVLVRCGSILEDDAVEVRDPLIVVEVLSPSTRARDSGAKLEDYFRLPSVHHYLIVKTETRSLTHHRRDDSGEIRTRIFASGRVSLNPPGIILDLDHVLAKPR